MRGASESPGCERCPFAVKGKPQTPVAAEGADDPAWIIVGEGPGENERQQLRPFVGASGQMLDTVLKLIGAERHKLWVTNALLCTPAGAKDNHKERARQCCQERLYNELRQFPGKPVLTLGALAAKMVLGDNSILDYAGALHQLDLGEIALGKAPRYVIPTIHPAFILRGGGDDDARANDGYFFALVYDVNKVHRLAQD